MTHPAHPMPIDRACRLPCRQGVLALMTALCCAWPAAASATTWIWLDDAGRRVYSDQPPPASLPAKRLLQAGSPRAAPAEAAAENPNVPGGPGNAPSAAPGPGNPPVAPANAANPARPGAAPAAAADTPQQAAQRRAIEARNAEIKADNCQRAQAAMTTLRSNTRLMMTNAEGRQVPMDAASRQAEMARLEQIIGANCN